ncbi:MAG TPA: superoxide dismutase [Cu-Zn] SodC [Burkholderiales bacterium]|mgnify:CR=1 FL=1
MKPRKGLRRRAVFSAIVCAGTLGTAASAATLEVPMHAVDANGVGARIGTVRVEDSAKGVLFDVELQGIPPGEHGFHVHERAECGPKAQDGKTTAAAAAGGHYDPGKTGRHAGPTGGGHLGDLPAVKADGQGRVRAQVLAPRLKISDLKGRSLMVHAGGDNYADDPKPLGGGGARIACGRIG